MIKRFFIYVFAFFVLSVVFYVVPSNVFAADFKTDYQVEYHLSQVKGSLDSKVDFSIAITNLRSDIYVNKFSISFPKTFAINNLSSHDEHGPIKPTITDDGTKTKIEMEFNDPNMGRDSVNTFYLSFNQSNLFKINGSVWEVILPVIENKDNSNYKVIVDLPDGTDKKISISKPKPTSISGEQIIWDNPDTKTIYAVFGDSQLYKVNLSYHLKNTRVTPAYIEVAFPPDTIYQKIYINSLTQVPDKVYQDDDGNFMGIYFLKPLETKNIVANFTVQEFSKERNEVLPAVRDAFLKQKNYLLNSQKYWDLKSVDKISNLKTAADIYSFVTSTLSYSYSRVTTDNIRLGAQEALTHPNLAVCMEFTDLFVAAAREKGLYSREIEGFGNSSDQSLRPLSLSSDVLHAWPEFYDTNEAIWKPVDPTWDNTSGIDYFSSFDLNHITFVIHGEKSDYPLPAGMYKIEDSKDVEVTATTDNPGENKDIEIINSDLPAVMSDNRTYQGKFTVYNLSNVYLWNIPINIKADNIDISFNKTNILSIAPYEKKEISFEYVAKSKNVKKDADISIMLSNNPSYNKKIVIIPYIYDLGIKAAIGSVLLLIAIFIVIFIRSRINRKND